MHLPGLDLRYGGIRIDLPKGRLREAYDDARACTQHSIRGLYGHVCFRHFEHL